MRSAIRIIVSPIPKPISIPARQFSTSRLLNPRARPSIRSRTMSTGPSSETAQLQKESQSPVTSKVPSFSELGIENTNISTAPGVELSTDQKTLVGSILDLFAGRPSLKKLSLWTDNATFQDPLTIAQGRKQYAPQWYGLQTAFSEIERLHHQVTSAGNPIVMDLKTRYKIKGLGVEKVIESVVQIHTADGKITEVQDRWNNELPDGAFTKALRNLNSVTVPMFVSVPANEEEDRKRGN